MGQHQRRRRASRYPVFHLLFAALLPTGALSQETTAIAPRPSPDGFTTITTASTASALPSSTLGSSSSFATSAVQANDRSEGFNYYFIVIAGAAVLFVLFFVFMARRRRIQAILTHANTQRALSEDIAGFRSPRYGRGWGPEPTAEGAGSYRHGMRMVGRPRREEVPEGLNERGEAPPPYIPGSKPPSLRTDDGRMSSESLREMGDMRRPVYQIVPKGEPPEYHREQTGSSSHYTSRREETTGTTGPEEIVTRPDNAITRP